MADWLITHRTLYQYPSPVERALHLAWLKPRQHTAQALLDFRLECDPAPGQLLWHVDFYGNDFCFMEHLASHLYLRVTSYATVSCPDLGWPKTAGVTPWERARPEPTDTEGHEFTQCNTGTEFLIELQEYVRPSFPPNRPLGEAVLDLNRRIHADFVYVTGSTDVSTPLESVFRLRRGVCQDFAHLAIECLRSLGLPARYVSGYVKPMIGGQPATGASHAWAGVRDTDGRWLDFDPTNACIPRGGHITLAWGRTYHDCPPLKGLIFGGGTAHPQVAVEMSPLKA